MVIINMGAMMLKILQPDQYYKDIFAVDLKSLKKHGIKGIICDIDNTIVPWSEEEVMEEVTDWIAGLRKNGFKICLLSNGLDSRVRFFSEKLKVPGIGRAVKPKKKAFIQARNLLGLQAEEIAIIGDQIFTDVLGGNRAGFRTVLVNPLARREFITTKFFRLLEKIVYKRE